MKATRYDYRWLELEGASYTPYVDRLVMSGGKRGWYYKNEFIGYNATEAITRLRVIKGYKSEVK